MLVWRIKLLSYAFCACLLIEVCAHGGEIAYVTDQLPAPASAGSAYSLPDFFAETSEHFEPAQFQQPLAPSLEANSAASLPSAADSASRQFTAALQQSSLGGGFAGSGYGLPSVDFTTNNQGTLRATTDAGDLIGASPGITSVGLQRRNPIVNDPRVRGSRVGALSASGSYWVPARIDLDTAVSKVDSRIVERASVIPGPYSALYGPGFEFMDLELMKAPRYDHGFQTHGRTSFDYRDNGDQWYGRQSFDGGDDVWGFRVGYGHRTGNDYFSGDGSQIPASYKSRDVDVALGAQLTSSQAIDVNYLRLDQTDIELAGQAFDIDFLVTDGVDVQYVSEASTIADRMVVDTWYNRTRFEGSAQRPSKRAQFPYYDFIDFVGFTDVDSTSTGYRAAWSWEACEGECLTAGTDLRFVKQELNEITSGRLGFDIWTDANSPVPDSDYTNPGLFVDYVSGTIEEGRVTRWGARLDYVGTRIVEPLANLEELGIAQPQSSAGEILGSDDFDQDEFLGLAYASFDWQIFDGWTSGASIGYAERAPNLTERYAVEPFMFLIQNGLNTVTGDPLLDKERMVQFDLRLARNTDRFHGDVSFFYSWINDYITFESMRTVPGPPAGDVVQNNLKYVNTELATLWGFEGRFEYDLTRRLRPYGTLKYVEGDDRTRNGTFATQQAAPGSPSQQVQGVSRGSFSGLAGNAQEPLPGILPLESRLGVQLDDGREDPRWGVDVSCRMVAAQDRVASSLLESTTPGFSTWDLRSFWRPRDQWLLIGGIENFTDKQYREHLDFRSLTGVSVFRPGTTFYVGASIEY